MVINMMFFLKRELRRLRRQLDGIVEIDTNTGLTTTTSDKDVAELAASINTMLERNRRTLFEKNSAEAALKRAVTNISHDLRTPLTSALGYLQMLESGGLDKKTQARYLKTIKERLESLSALMNSLFEFARVIEGNTELDIRPINICNILRDTLSESYAELEAKGFTLDVEITDKPETRLCDEDGLRRVIQNLIKNAYTHGREHISIRVDDGVIKITNKAEGLEELDTGRIFERFYTTDTSRTSKNTGLGLAIAKELTENMGGCISASVDGENFIIQIQFPKD